MKRRRFIAIEKEGGREAKEKGWRTRSVCEVSSSIATAVDECLSVTPPHPPSVFLLSHFYGIAGDTKVLLSLMTPKMPAPWWVMARSE